MSRKLAIVWVVFLGAGRICSDIHNVRVGPATKNVVYTHINISFFHNTGIMNKDYGNT